MLPVAIPALAPAVSVIAQETGGRERMEQLVEEAVR